MINIIANRNELVEMVWEGMDNARLTLDNPQVSLGMSAALFAKMGCPGKVTGLPVVISGRMHGFTWALINDFQYVAIGDMQFTDLEKEKQQL